jgi:DNA invertase Pin-like site-specific DNA recombinase
MPDPKDNEQLRNDIRAAGRRRALGRRTAKEAMEEMEPDIRELLRRGNSPTALAEISGLSRETIYQIKNAVDAETPAESA